MNRRSFFRSLSIATAAIYLRIAPSVANAAEVREKDIAPVPIVYDDAVRCHGMFVRYKGHVLTHEQMFKVVALKRSPAQAALLATFPKVEFEAI